MPGKDFEQNPMSLNQVYKMFTAMDTSAFNYVSRLGSIGSDLLEAAHDDTQSPDLTVNQREDVLFYLTENSVQRGKKLRSLQISMRETLRDTVRGQIYSLVQAGNFQVSEAKAGLLISTAVEAVANQLPTIDIFQLPNSNDQLKKMAYKDLRFRTDALTFDVICALLSTIRDQAAQLVNQLKSDGWSTEDAQNKVKQEIITVAINEENLTQVNTRRLML